MDDLHAKNVVTKYHHGTNGIIKWQHMALVPVRVLSVPCSTLSTIIHYALSLWCPPFIGLPVFLWQFGMKNMKKPRSARGNGSAKEMRTSPGVDHEAVQTLSQLSELVNQSQTLSQFNETIDLHFRGGSQPGSQPLFSAPLEFGPLGLSSQAEESMPVAPVPKPIQHYSRDSPNAQAGSLHRTARGTRRGPMDEMRQLARILVKIIPHSVGFLVVSEDGGGACVLLGEGGADGGEHAVDR